MRRARIGESVKSPRVQQQHDDGESREHEFDDHPVVLDQAPQGDQCLRHPGDQAGDSERDQHVPGQRPQEQVDLDATAALIAEHGLAVNMSQIAAHVGIGRATLYKYFPDVQAIVAAWHDRQVTAHLDQLTGVAAQHQDPGERLRTVLATYLRLSSTGRHTGHDGGPAAQLAAALPSAGSRDRLLEVTWAGLLPPR
jgi:hypothetical protein